MLSRSKHYKVCSLIFSFNFPFRYHQKYTFTSSFSSNSAQSSTNLKNTHFSSSDFNLGKLVFSKYYALLNDKFDNFCNSNARLSELLLRISHVCPGTTRKLLGVCDWKPVHVVELLLGFDSGCRKAGFDGRSVECLWEIFRRVGVGNEGFVYLPKSCEVMASMLISVQMFREVEMLVSMAERRGIQVAGGVIYSGLIEGYVNTGELEKALLLYEEVKDQSIVLCLSCYRSLVRVLVECRDDRAICVFEDVVGASFEIGDVEARNLEILVGLLCRDGKVVRVRKLIRKVVASGWIPTKAILSNISDVYCEKKDYEDLLDFFIDMKCVPDSLTGNKILHSLCSHFGINRADSFLWELEQLGFSPNEITFGIFICFCCCNGELRNAFLYVSEIFSRDLKPDRLSYNALISCMFKEGMNEHVRHVVDEMIENGIKPDVVTYKALLAGYCKARQFNEVKSLIRDMAKSGLVLVSPLENPISKAFSVLGLNPLAVKVKRDNDLSNFRAEFFDELGNGLYLDTNLDEFDKTVAGVLDESLVPDFNLVVMRQCGCKSVQEALSKVHEMIQWGQELSLPVLSAFVRLLCSSKSHIKAIPSLLDSMYPSFIKLDHETLNLLIQALSKKGFADKCKLIFDDMQKRHIPITNATHTFVLMGLCKLGKVADICYWWNVARKSSWLPEWRDFVIVLDYLCQKRMLKEALELFDIMMASASGSVMQILDVFFQNLCSSGFTGVAHMLIKELNLNGCMLDDAVYNHLIKGYCEEKMSSDALMLYDSLSDNFTLHFNTRLLLVSKLCKVNRFQEAFSLMKTGLGDPSTSVFLYSALIGSYCRAGKVTEAEGLFHEMISRSITPNSVIYNNLLQGHCLSSNLKIAKQLLSVMIKRSLSLSVSSYRDLLRLLCRNEMVRFAWGLKCLMLVQSKYSSSVICNILIFYLFRTGNHHYVSSLLDELREAGQQLDGVGYNFLVHGFLVCKDPEKSVGYLNEMMVMDLRPSNRSLRAVIRYLCSNEQVHDAMKLCDQINLRGWGLCSTVQYTLLQGLISNGRILQAEKLVARSMETGLVSDAIIYDNLVKKFARYGCLETAVYLLDHILKGRSIPDSSSYDCIVQSFCANNLDHAMDFLSEMLHRNLKPELGTWDMLIEKFCMNGNTKEAERLLTSMISIGETPTKRMYSTVINQYRSENNLPKASELLHQMQRHGYEPDFTTQWSLISSLSNSSSGHGNNDSQGFLSKLLGGSGFFSVGRTNSK